MQPVSRNFSAQENVFAGIIGSLLFSLVGGIIWFLLYQIGFIASISGLVGVICAIKGYSFFSKKESIKGIVISILATLFTMCLAWYLCLSLDVYNAYQEWFATGEIDFTLTLGESVGNAYLFLEDPELARAYFGDLAMGLVFCIIGGVGYVISSIKRVKQAPVQTEEVPVPTESDFVAEQRREEQSNRDSLS